MAAFTKFNSFVEAMAEKTHNLGADALKIALCAAANAPVAGNTKLADLVEVSYTNCSSRAVSVVSSSQSGGLYKLVLSNLTLTASGSVGPFRYVVLYNDSALNKELIGFYDYGSDLTLSTSETFTITFDAVNGAIQVS